MAGGYPIGQHSSKAFLQIRFAEHSLLALTVKGLGFASIKKPGDRNLMVSSTGESVEWSEDWRTTTC